MKKYDTFLEDICICTSNKSKFYDTALFKISSFDRLISIEKSIFYYNTNFCVIREIFNKGFKAL